MTFQHRLVVAGWAMAGLFVFVGCMPQIAVQRRDDGVYHLTCKAVPLPRCLQQAEEVCGHDRYAVLRAFDDHDYSGRSDAPHETRDSEAYIMCGSHAVWGTQLTKLRLDPMADAKLCPVPPAPPPAASKRVCIPGATQACVGAAGCSGGQSCVADGSAFGPCDCGGPATTPS